MLTLRLITWEKDKSKDCSKCGHQGQIICRVHEINRFNRDGTKNTASLIQLLDEAEKDLMLGRIPTIEFLETPDIKKEEK